MLKKCPKSLVLQTKNVSVCTFKTSPFVLAPRAHVYKTCARVVLVHTGTFRTCTRRRVEWTHGVFQRVRHDTPQHNTTQHNNTTTTPHGDRDRDRQRQTETDKEDRDRERREDGRGETRQEKTREKKTRQDKRREKIHFQCGGARPFLVGVVIFCLFPFAHEI